MSGKTNISPAIDNKILKSLEKATLDKLAPEFELVTLSLGQTLFEAGDKVDSAFFVNSGLASSIAASTSGHSIEVGAIGKEGVLPVEALTGMQYVAHRYIMQLPGEAVKISIEALKRHLAGDISFCSRSLKLIQQLHSQSAQLVLCNRFHTVTQRLCRWLLMTSDWAQEDRFPITHEFLSLMLGINRSTVSLELGELKTAGIISYRQRLLDIKNKRQIASMSCECYWTHRRDMEAYIQAIQGSSRAGTSNMRAGGRKSTERHNPNGIRP